MTQTWASDPNFKRATRSTGVHPICDSQDVSRYPAVDPHFRGPALSRLDRIAVYYFAHRWPAVALLVAGSALFGAAVVAAILGWHV